MASPVPHAACGMHLLLSGEGKAMEYNAVTTEKFTVNEMDLKVPTAYAYLFVCIDEPT